MCAHTERWRESLDSGSYRGLTLLIFFGLNRTLFADCAPDLGGFKSILERFINGSATEFADRNILRKRWRPLRAEGES